MNPKKWSFEKIACQRSSRI